MKYVMFVLFCLTFISLTAQQNVKGIVLNELGQPIEFATVALLHASDSTFENFGISDINGNFEIKFIKNGKYLIQISFVGYQTYDSTISFPVLNTDLGIYFLYPKSELLNTVEISEERIPIQINGDTIIYDANAFKTQPEASVEDLLKKLPGMQIDQSGNIKAQGEDVQQVLVDGKEFFSSDPSVATKNLPADAIDKVEVYNKSSDESEFTGVDDGMRNKTINLLLKDDKKSLWLGDLSGGVGNENKFQSQAKLYRFTKVNQFAALGMYNNINQFGFSMHDYIDFNGGIGNVMRNGGFRIESSGENETPINFGQQIDGLIHSGAGGINFTHEKIPGNRWNISYLGNGYQKNLLQTATTNNYFEDNFFSSFDSLQEESRSFYHRVNFNLKNKPDSMQHFFANGAFTINYGNKDAFSFQNSFQADTILNDLFSASQNGANNISGNVNGSYIHKLKSDWRYIKANISLSGKSSLSESQWNNLTQYFDAGEIFQDSALQNNSKQYLNYTSLLLASRKLNSEIYIEPYIEAGGVTELLQLKQNDLLHDGILIDSLSPNLQRQNLWISPAIQFKYNTKKTQAKISIDAEYLYMNHHFNDTLSIYSTHYFFTPKFNFEKDFKQGRHLRFSYETFVNAPNVEQLLPVIDYTNSIVLYKGNILLDPEYQQTLNANWLLFDQFSFTSLFTNFQMNYIKNKISYSKSIDENFIQTIELTNVPYDFNVTGEIDFSTPIRFLKINTNLRLSEMYNQGISYVNIEENMIQSFTHAIELSIDNREKDKIDIVLGADFEFTQSSYSIDLSKTRYLVSNYFSEIDFTPNKFWRFSVDANIFNYEILDASTQIQIPLLKAEITRFILPSNRGSITLKGYDILDKNSGIVQSSAFNYFSIQQSNTIGRYFMLTFKYRINKTEIDQGFQIEVDN